MNRTPGVADSTCIVTSERSPQDTMADAAAAPTSKRWVQRLNDM